MQCYCWSHQSFPPKIQEAGEHQSQIDNQNTLKGQTTVLDLMHQNNQLYKYIDIYTHVHIVFGVPEAYIIYYDGKLTTHNAASMQE